MGLYVLGWADHVYMFFFGFLLPMIILTQGKPDMKLLDLTGKQKIALYYSNGLMMWIGTFLVFIIWLVWQRSFVDFGFRLPILTTTTLFAAGFLIGSYLLDLFLQTMLPKRRLKTIKKWKEDTPFLPLNWKEYSHFTFAAFSAGFCEEVIFRGFMVNYILALSGGHWSSIYVAILLPAMIFGALHVYQGHAAVNKIIIGGILFGIIYYCSKSLLIVVVVHFLIDMLAAYVHMRMMRHQDRV